MAALTDVERAEMLALHQAGASQRTIAEQTGRNRNTVKTVLAALRPTKLLAQAHFDASALPLAQRITDQASVEQALEVLDRLDVLPKKRDAIGGSHFQVIIGMPGHPAMPIPTQSDMARALATAPDIPPPPAKALSPAIVAALAPTPPPHDP